MTSDLECDYDSEFTEERPFSECGFVTTYIQDDGFVRNTNLYLSRTYAAGRLDGIFGTISFNLASTIVPVTVSLAQRVRLLLCGFRGQIM